MVEELLQLLVGEVNTQLFETVELFDERTCRLVHLVELNLLLNLEFLSENCRSKCFVCFILKLFDGL
jgi:hypothetical protein